MGPLLQQRKMPAEERRTKNLEGHREIVHDDDDDNDDDDNGDNGVDRLH